MARASFRQRVDQVVYGPAVRRGGRGGRRPGRPPEDGVQQFHKRDDEVRGDAGRRVLQGRVRVGRNRQRHGAGAGHQAAGPEEQQTRTQNRNGRRRRRRYQRTGIVAVVQLGTAEGPGIRNDQREVVRAERRQRPRSTGRAPPQRIREGERTRARPATEI